MKPLWVGQQHHYMVDTRFDWASSVVVHHTGMDEFRRFQLWHLAAESAKLDGGEILEVGCGLGGSGFMIAVSVRLAGVKDRVYLCDSFFGLVKADAEFDTLQNGEMGNTSPEKVEELISTHGIDNVSVVQGVFPDQHDFLSDHRFRFVHIDVDIYRSMKDAFEWVWPRMVSGGIVILDD